MNLDLVCKNMFSSIWATYFFFSLYDAMTPALKEKKRGQYTNTLRMSKGAYHSLLMRNLTMVFVMPTIQCFKTFDSLSNGSQQPFNNRNITRTFSFLRVPQDNRQSYLCLLPARITSKHWAGLCND